jgi:hypothetical protein
MWLVDTAAAIAAMNAVTRFLCFFLLFKEARKDFVFREVVETIMTRYEQQNARETLNIDLKRLL